ncbi:MAG: TonB-dependent receptor domain-containing protein, partial [Flavobacteriales bacterium]
QADFSFAFEKPSFRLSVSAYTNMINDKVYLAPTGNTTDSLPVYQFRQSDASINGFEAGLDVHPADVSWVDLAISYASIRGKLSGGIGYLPAQPADKLVAAITFSKDRMQDLYRPYIRFAVSSYAAMNRVAEFEATTDSYMLFDVHLGGAIKIGQHFMDVAVSGTNLLNTGFYNHLSLIPRDLQILEMGRNISLRLSIPFGIVNPDRPKSAPSGS